MKRPSLAEVLQKAVDENQLNQTHEVNEPEDGPSVFVVAMSKDDADLIFRALQLFRIDVTVNCPGCLSDAPLVSIDHDPTCNRLQESTAVNYIRNRAARSGGSSLWFAGGKAVRVIYSADNNAKRGLPGYIENFLQMIRMQYPRPTAPSANYIPNLTFTTYRNYSGSTPGHPLTTEDIKDTERPLFDEGILREVLTEYAQQQERGTHDGPDRT